MAFNDLDSSNGVQEVKEFINSAVETTLTATTTAQIAKVGVSNLTNRRYLFLQAKSNNVKWGFTSACLFDLFKDSNVWLPVNEEQDIYIKTTSGSVNVIVAEGAGNAT